MTQDRTSADLVERWAIRLCYHPAVNMDKWLSHTGEHIREAMRATARNALDVQASFYQDRTPSAEEVAGELQAWLMLSLGWLQDGQHRNLAQWKPRLVLALDAYAARVSAEAVKAERERLHAVLRKHHEWHLQSGSVGLPDGEGGWIEIDNAAEYSDSVLCSETIRALTDDTAPQAGEP